MARTQTKTAVRKREAVSSGYGRVGMYVDGNTVRKLESVPERREERKPRTRSAVRQKRARALQMNLSYVVFLTAAAVITVMVCINYLKLQSQSTTYQKKVTSLNTQLSEMKLENDALYNSIVSSVDLEHVKEVAINELGMSYPSEDQIYTYQPSESDYVKQFQDVPTE